MISRPDNEMGRSFAAYASTFVLFTGQMALAASRTQKGDYWWAAVGSLIMCFAALCSCHVVDNVTNDVETREYEHGAWVVSRGKALLALPTLVTVSDYAPEMSPWYNKHLAIGAAFAMILGYILNYLGLRQLPWGSSFAYIVLVGLGALLRQYVAGLRPLDPIQDANITEILHNISSRRSHWSHTFGNEPGDRGATLESGIFISRGGVMTVEAAARVLDTTNSHTDSQGNSFAIGNAVCAGHDGSCVVVATDRCSDRDRRLVQSLLVDKYEGTVKTASYMELRMAKRAREAALLVEMGQKEPFGTELPEDLSGENADWYNDISLRTSLESYHSAQSQLHTAAHTELFISD